MKFIQKTFIAFLVFPWISFMMYATNYYTIGNGNWGSQKNWLNNKVPPYTLQVNDTIFIRNTITFPQDLTIFGTLIIDNGKILADNGQKDVNINNYGKVIVYGILECEDLNISTNGTLEIHGAVIVNGTYTNNGEVSVETTESQTGNLLVKGIINGSPNISFSRYIECDGWHYFSSPVSNASTNLFKGMAVYSYNEPMGQWVRHGANEQFQVMKGYDIYLKNYSKTITFEGNFNNSDYSINLTRTLNGGIGYNLVGNPYPTTIDWNSTNGWTKTNVNNAIYIWDPISKNISSYVNGVGLNGGSNLIPPTSAFFVICNNTSGGLLGINKNARVSSTVNFREIQTSDLLLITLNGNQYKDETVIRFMDNTAETFEGEWDALKMFSFEKMVPQIYTITTGQENLAINTMRYPVNSVSIAIGTYIPAPGNYQMTFNLNNLDANYDFYLEDKNNNTIFNLKEGSYNFFSESGEISDRFLLHMVPIQSIFDNTSGLTENNQIDKVTVFASDRTVNIISQDVAFNRISISDISGKTIFLKNNAENENIIRINLENSGIYFIRYSIQGEENTRKIFIK